MKYGLIGKTLVHSYSKEIHESLGRYEYNLFSLSPEKVAPFVKAHDFGGLNVTIPYKKDVIPLCDRVSELASSIGAVNTLYRKDGLLIGHNTDYEGFLYAAKRAGIDFNDRTVLILGTGGTSLMALKAVKERNAAEIFRASRSEKSDAISYDRLPEIADRVEIIINTTPVGTFPDNMNSVISLDDFKNCSAVMDVIYNPFKTKLLLQAEARNLKYSNGLPMLVAQATAAAGYFLGTPGAFEIENERIISKMETDMSNIVLIGMPGCGKSTIGRLISELTGKEFIDMDEEIEKTAGVTIPEIFASEGEAGFRDRESQTALELGKQHNLVIATGGGAVLRPENIDALRQNGTLIHVKRPLSFLATKGRPLSRDNDALRKMENERMPIYEAAADITFDNSKRMNKINLKENIRKVLKLQSS